MTSITGAPAGTPTGVLAASLTPLDAEYDPDIGRFLAHSRWLLANGCDALGILGTTGEANSLSLASRLALIERACAELPPERLLVGVGSPALADAVALTRASLEGGAGAVLALPPYYYKPVTDDGLLAFFSELIERTADARLRLHLYNFPQLTGITFSTLLIERLRDRYGPIVAGLKDSSGRWESMEAYCRRLPGFNTFAGTERYLLDILRIGGAGCISATANVTARACAAVLAAFREGAPGKADALQERLTAVRGTIERQALIPALKALTAGRMEDPAWRRCLPPFLPLPAAEAEGLAAALGRLDFSW
jgi:4-hydroxy-tetrahydrodipicolinate synthase